MQMKKTVAVILCAVLILSMSGCIVIQNGKNDNTEPSTVENALEYMQDKYGEEFRYAGPSGNSMSGTRSFYVVCDSVPEKQIKVRIENYSDENMVIRDNFLAYKYEDDIREWIVDAVSAEFSDPILYFSITGVPLSADIPGDATFEDVLHDPALYINAKVELHASELTSFEAAERAVAPITETAGEYFISLLAVEEDNFGRLTSDELDEMIAAEDCVAYASFYKVNGTVLSDWKFQNTKGDQ